MPIRLGFFHSLLRQDEKLLLEELSKQDGIVVEMIDARLTELFNCAVEHLDAILLRSVSHNQNYYAAAIFEARGVRCINSFSTVRICGDKLLTALALKKAGIRQPKVWACFGINGGLQCIQQLSLPVVMKPPVGSWGRLLAKITDTNMAEAVLEHKCTLGSYQHQTIFLQEYVEKNGKDIRAFVVGGKCIAAIYRESSHWITNTAKGGRAVNCPLTSALCSVAEQAATCVKGSVIAIDIFETATGYFVNEINDTMEFKNSIATTGINIPAHIVSYIVKELSMR